MPGLAGARKGARESVRGQNRGLGAAKHETFSDFKFFSDFLDRKKSICEVPKVSPHEISSNKFVNS